MKPKTMVLLIVAVVCGLLAAYVANNMGPQANTDSEYGKIAVWVPKTNLPSGKKIDKLDELFVKIKYKPEEIRPEWITKDSDLKDAVVSHNLRAYVPVIKSDLDSGTPILQLLPKGYRALSIPANSASAGSGFVLPGNRVDVLCSLAARDNSGEKLTKTFLYNVLVLAVNQEDEAKQQERKTITPSTVTLALQPEDAERVSWVVSGAGGAPTIALALRRPDDDDLKKTPGTRSPFRPDDDPTAKNGPNATTGPAAIAMVMVPFAKKDIEIGTLIDNQAKFDEYFEEVGVPDVVARNAILKESLLAKKAPLYTKLLEKTFPTPKHFDPTAPKTVLTMGSYRIGNGKEEVITVYYNKTTGAILKQGEMMAPAPEDKAGPAAGEGR